MESPPLGPNDARVAVAEIWKRPADLTAAFSVLETHPGWSKHIDHDRVGTLGFFLGGTSALSLAGAQLDAQSYSQSCDDGGAGMDCSWFEQFGVDLHCIDTARLVRSNLDPRIRAAVVVDPELSTSFSAESLSDISIPVAVINLDQPDTRPPGLNASALATNALRIEYTTLPKATRFSTFSLCKPEGGDILARTQISAMQIPR